MSVMTVAMICTSLASWAWSSVGVRVAGDQVPALCHFEGNTYSPGAVVEMVDGVSRACRLADGVPMWNHD